MLFPGWCDGNGHWNRHRPLIVHHRHRRLPPRSQRWGPWPSGQWQNLICLNHRSVHNGSYKHLQTFQNWRLNIIDTLDDGEILHHQKKDGWNPINHLSTIYPIINWNPISRRIVDNGINITYQLVQDFFHMMHPVHLVQVIMSPLPSRFSLSGLGPHTWEIHDITNRY